MSRVESGVVPFQTGAPQEPFDPLKFVSTIQNLKLQKQMAARQGLDTMSKLAEAGMLGPEHAGKMESLFKEAFPEIQGKAAPPAAGGPAPQVGPQQSIFNPSGQPLPPGVTPQNVSAAGAAAQGPPQGAAGATPVSRQAGAARPAGGVTPDAMSPGSGQFEKYLTQARDLAAAKGANAQQQLAIQQHVGNMMNTILTDPNSQMAQDVKRTLQVAGIMDLSPEKELLLNPTKGPQVMQSLYEKSTQGESEAERALRTKDLARDAAMKGYFANPQEAERYFAGDTSVQKRMTPEDYLRKAQSLREMVDMGVPPGAAIKASDAAGMGLDPWKMLPDSFKPLAQQAMDLRSEEVRGQLGLGRQRVGLEKEELGLKWSELDQQTKSATQRLMVELGQANNKALWDRMQFLMDSKQKGLKLPEGFEEATISDVARTMGAKLQEDTGLLTKGLRWLAGAPGYPGWMKPGRSFEVVPTTTPEEDSIINRGIGGPQTPPELNPRSVIQVSPKADLDTFYGTPNLRK